MFTGLVEATGHLHSRTEIKGSGFDDQRLLIETPLGFMDGVRQGDSISCNGVCLTALDVSGKTFAVDVSAETLRLTSLGTLTIGAQINLEKALLANSRLGGHLVSGHVDALAQLLHIESQARSWRYDFELPPQLARFVAVKGSITLDGVSLTVNTVSEDRFSVNIIPHTLEKTNLSKLALGAFVNLEVDLIARYLDRLHSHEWVVE
jgi:riboflavin synthase